MNIFLLVFIFVLVICAIIYFYAIGQKVTCTTDCTSGVIYDYIDKNPNVSFIDKETFSSIVKSTNDNENLALLNISKCISNRDKNVAVSNYKVGACVLGASGKVYFGINMEFSSILINTVHAEQCAIHNAAIEGETSIIKLAVNAPPCGSCRQYLVDIGIPADLKIIFCENGIMTVNTLEDLLPLNFGPINLGMTESVFSHPLWTIQNSGITGNNGNNEIQKKAVEMLTKSFAPYTKTPEGIVIQFQDNTYVFGQKIENAAYNPTVSAIRGALSIASLKQKMLVNNPIIKIVLAIGNTDVTSSLSIKEVYNLANQLGVTDNKITIINLPNCTN